MTSRTTSGLGTSGRITSGTLRCVGLLLLGAGSAGCAGASAPVTIAAAEPTAIEIVPVSFELRERVTIDNAGAVRLGVGLFGNLSSDGRLVGSDGTVIATLSRDGVVRIGDTPSFRIASEGVPQAFPILEGHEGPPAYFMDESSLVVGETNQAIPVAGYRQGAADETLFVASVIVGLRPDAWVD